VIVARPSARNPDASGCQIARHVIATQVSTLLLSGLTDLGRVVLSADGSEVYFETADALVGADTNGTRDIYRIDATGGLATPEWVSVPSAGLGAGGLCSDPAVLLDGKTVYFICRTRLLDSDVDGREGIYRATRQQGGGFVLEHVRTGLPAIALDSKGVTDGRSLVYSVRTRAGSRGCLVQNLATTQEVTLAPQANNITLTAALTADSSRIVFSSPASNLVASDRNASTDVFTAPTPLAQPALAVPTVLLSTTPASPITEGTSLVVNAIADNGSESVRLTELHLNGMPVAGTQGPSLTGVVLNLEPGIHRLFARAENSRGGEGRSLEREVLVTPLDGLPVLASFDPPQVRVEQDGSRRFSTNVRVNNPSGSVTNPLRLIVTEASVPTIISDLFASFDSVPDGVERIIQTIEIPALAARETRLLSVEGVASAPRAIGNGFQGIGWVVQANLQLGDSSNGFTTLTPTRTELFRYAPRLDDDTPGPNGGVPLFGTPVVDSAFDPPTVNRLQISAPPRVLAGTAVPLTASFLFANQTTKPVAPTWSLSQIPGIQATIDRTGVLRVLSATRSGTLNVNAAFAGAQAVTQVQVSPATPIIAVIVADPVCSENGKSGAFRVVRSSAVGSALTVSLEYSGSANIPGDVTVPLTAEFPPGATSVVLPVVPVQDSIFEGNETITVRIVPSANYRVSRADRATLVVRDDEVFPANQVDASLRRPGFAPVGVDVVDSVIPVTRQILEAPAILNQPIGVILNVRNRGTTPRNFTVKGPAPGLGYTVRYLSGRTDITDTVIAGTFQLSNIPGGASVDIVAVVVPTLQAITGVPFPATFRVTTDNGNPDHVTFNVTRIR
jgi:hypothetical protein